MKLFKKMKDGGPESKVYGYFLVEIKGLFSIALLKFSDGSREAFHSHAFSSISWLLSGYLEEHGLFTDGVQVVKDYDPSLRPIMTYRSTFHRVISHKDSWVLTFRGPWSKTWKEFLPNTGETLTLTHGREVVY